MIAARLGHVEGVTALLEYGARVDPLSSTGETPLIAAVHRRDIPLVRVLLAEQLYRGWTLLTGHPYHR